MVKLGVEPTPYGLSLGYNQVTVFMLLITTPKFTPTLILTKPKC